MKVRSHAYAARDPTDGDRALDAAAAKAHDGPLEDLDALPGALDDARVDSHGVAGGELRKVGPDLILNYLVEHVHGVPYSSSSGASGAAAHSGRYCPQPGCDEDT